MEHNPEISKNDQPEPNSQNILYFASQNEMLTSNEVRIMPKKNVAIPVTISPTLKEEAEAIITKLGLTPSDVIESLYSQIALTGALPYSFTVQPPRCLQPMSEEEIEDVVLKGLEEGERGEGTEAKEFFAQLKERLP